MLNEPIISLSIVSHGQLAIIAPLLRDLLRLSLESTEVILTLNLPEDESILDQVDLDLVVIRNAIPKGFGANHNAAFDVSRGRFFIVVNPDIRLDSFDPHLLLDSMSDSEVGAVAPVVVNGDNQLEDSVRKFPTVTRLLTRVLFRKRSRDYHWGESPIQIDWVAGMFVVFKREAFRSVNGFDDKRFYMYFEDVDICRRFRLRGWKVILHPKVIVKHFAQRASHRNLQHLRWHLTSAFRYLVGI